jgi:hypothetical protein
MSAAIDLSNQKFGRLTAIRPTHKDARNNVIWECLCECGNTTHVKTLKLRSGHTRSCGCLRREKQMAGNPTHGLFYSGENKIWVGMKARCKRPANDSFENYGGRGITVDPRWEKFENFYADMGPRPSPQHSIERIDNDKGYGPDNCIWASPQEQARNRRTNHWLDTPRGRFILTEAAAEYGLPRPTLAKRLKKGWPVEKALTTPVRGHA